MYQTQTSKIRGFIQDKILPVLVIDDLDYLKVVNFISMNCNVSYKRAQENINLHISMGEIKKEGNVLTIPDKKIENYIKFVKEKEKTEEETKEDLKNAFEDEVKNANNK